MGIMTIQDRTGDTALAWNVEDKASTALAEKTFNDLMAKQHMAYITKDGGGEVIKSFDPNADEIIVAVPLVWG